MRQHTPHDSIDAARGVRRQCDAQFGRLPAEIMLTYNHARLSRDNCVPHRRYCHRPANQRPQLNLSAIAATTCMPTTAWLPAQYDNSPMTAWPRGHAGTLYRANGQHLSTTTASSWLCVKGCTTRNRCQIAHTNESAAPCWQLLFAAPLTLSSRPSDAAQHSDVLTGPRTMQS